MNPDCILASKSNLRRVLDSVGFITQFLLCGDLCATLTCSLGTKDGRSSELETSVGDSLVVVG